MKVMVTGESPRALVIRVSRRAFLTLVAFSIFSLAPLAFAENRWLGVDESVVEKIAKEHGREAQDSLINTDKGDLLLFVFLAAGSIAGFAAGYYWRILLESRQKQDRREPHEYQR